LAIGEYSGKRKIFRLVKDRVITVTFHSTCRQPLTALK